MLLKLWILIFNLRYDSLSSVFSPRCKFVRHCKKLCSFTRYLCHTNRYTTRLNMLYIYAWISLLIYRQNTVLDVFIIIYCHYHHHLWLIYHEISNVKRDFCFNMLLTLFALSIRSQTIFVAECRMLGVLINCQDLCLFMFLLLLFNVSTVYSRLSWNQHFWRYCLLWFIINACINR